MTTRKVSTAALPVTVEEAKLRLRIDLTEDDVDIQVMIAAATEMAEQITGRAIAQNVYEIRLDAFPTGAIVLLNPPITSIESVKYVAASGDEVTLGAGSYTLDSHSEPGRLLPGSGTSWPAALVSENAVRVRYSAGYGLACPLSIKQWVLLQVGHWYKNREAASEKASFKSPYADGLLDAHIIWRA